MARTEAQKEWRKTKKRILVQLEVTEDTKALWDAYAQQMGVPTGRMVRICVEKCLHADGWLVNGRLHGLIEGWTEDGTATVAPDVAPDQPTANDVQNG